MSNKITTKDSKKLKTNTFYELFHDTVIRRRIFLSMRHTINRLDLDARVDLRVTDTHDYCTKYGYKRCEIC